MRKHVTRTYHGGQGIVTKFSEHFGLGRSQNELDFVDVLLETDALLFIDPFAISQRTNRWSQEADGLLLGFFQRVVDSIREGRDGEARRLLSGLHEPNETRLGYSSRRPQGAGIGRMQANQLLEALRESSAVRTGFLSSLEECELMIDGIGSDKISDLTTNIIRGMLVEYTVQQCELHGVPTHRVALPPRFSLETCSWVSEYADVPLADSKPILLVPKAIVRYEPAYNHQHYYRHFVLEFLQVEHLAAGSALVHALKNGSRRVYKNDLQAIHPCTKEFLFEFSREHPEVLEAYRHHLAQLEQRGLQSQVAEEDECVIAAALRAALSSIAPGGASASDYHRLMIGVVEFLFFPVLTSPRKELEIHKGRKRIDIVMENSAAEGAFYNLHAVKKLPSAYVAIECKNYSTDVANPELDQLSGRFSPNRGKIGFMCCRTFENRQLFVERCRDTLRDDRGLILALDDARIDSMLGLVEAGNRRFLDSKIVKLVDEVWLA
jgi:hypothetical protein